MSLGPITCSTDSFTCDNGRCIDTSLQCNIIDDCGDLSDERGCAEGGGTVRPVHECGELEFLCHENSTVCVAEVARCNGTAECPNGDDEMDCQNCQLDEFECTNRKCIAQSWLCDGTDDCGDKSDEQPELCAGAGAGAGSNHTSILLQHRQRQQQQHKQLQQTQVPCEEGYRCKSGHCIDMHTVCDGVENCYDGSDEYGSCGECIIVNVSVCH